MDENYILDTIGGIQKEIKAARNFPALSNNTKGTLNKKTKTEKKNRINDLFKPSNIKFTKISQCINFY